MRFEKFTFKVRQVVEEARRLAENPLALKILAGEILPGESVRVEAEAETCGIIFREAQGKTS